ncbi:unnamed protein product [Rotaria sordida]|uniref:CCHC-type domain-containing protein n=1 Tax=Rotaria sordida TaxID=392033 RepID=A0A815CVK6_9BILA|nr:unnamed protein product [Rotaria sordida]CAF3714167.1 unnamed protein product [Rotaria sordida]
MVSNSLNLVNDYVYDPTTNIHYYNNRNSPQNNIQASSSPTNIQNIQTIDSPARSIRRLHSDDHDDDFTMVTYKKKKKNNNNNNNLMYHKNQLYQQSSSSVNNNNGQSSSQVHNHRIITNSNLMHQKGTHDSSQHHPDITIAATRYAQTRSPFSPFIIRFSTGNVKDKQAAEEITLFFKNEHQIDILFSNYRLSTFKCSSKEYDILLFVKDANSFTSLLDEDKWPPQIGSQYYTFPSSPTIPPQLSLIIKNVDFHTDINDFSSDLKTKFPEIINVIRLKNKFQQDIKIVKIEFVSTSARDQILAAGKININYRSYDVEEYIAPARVLICSKCCGIGHFKRQCTQSNETCKTCGLSFPDLKQHVCSNLPNCIHCGGEHLSNVVSCPVVKQYRAALTKKLLLTTNYNSTSTVNCFKYDSVQFPQLNPSLNPSIAGSHNMILSKLNELATNMEKLNDNIFKITLCNEKFEKFMKDKIDSDKIIQQEINVLKNNDKALEVNQVQHELKLKRYENILVKLLMPMLDEMSKVVLILNHDQHGRPLDPGLKTNFEIIRTKLKLALEGKDLS